MTEPAIAGFDRAPETSRRIAAVELLLSMGFQWKDGMWHPVGPADESDAYTTWFNGEQGKAYHGFWEFAKAAWMARAAVATRNDAATLARDACMTSIGYVSTKDVDMMSRDDGSPMGEWRSALYSRDISRKVAGWPPQSEERVPVYVCSIKPSDAGVA